MAALRMTSYIFTVFLIIIAIVALILEIVVYSRLNKITDPTKTTADELNYTKRVSMIIGIGMLFIIIGFGLNIFTVYSEAQPVTRI